MERWAKEESGALPILIYGRDFRRLCLSDKVVHADAKPAPMDLPRAPRAPALFLIPSTTGVPIGGDETSARVRSVSHSSSLTRIRWDPGVDSSGAIAYVGSQQIASCSRFSSDIDRSAEI